MVKVSEDEFRQMVGEAMDSLPKQMANARNLAIVVEEMPSEEQARKLHLYRGQLLFGLYEGIPLTKRGAGYNFVLPDKITIFKKPLEAVSTDLEDLGRRVQHTVWHEIAHHYGLDHDHIQQLENKSHN